MAPSCCFLKIILLIFTLCISLGDFNWPIIRFTGPFPDCVESPDKLKETFALLPILFSGISFLLEICIPSYNFHLPVSAVLLFHKSIDRGGHSYLKFSVL